MAAKVAVILFAAIVVVLLIAYYVRKQPVDKQRPSDATRGVERFDTSRVLQEASRQRQSPDLMLEQLKPESLAAPAAPTKRVSFKEPVVTGAASAPPVPSEPGYNEDYIAVDYSSSVDKVAPANGPAGTCFPQDRLTPEDLLPKDAANTKWAQVVPAGQGDVKDQNFLTAGFHVGIDTVGQTRKNPNLQLRSELPNPKMAVSPWLNSSYEPDQYRRGFELGEA